MAEGRTQQEESARVCKALTFLCLLIAGCTILGVSFSVIEPTEVGMYYNPNTKRLFRESVYNGGRHAVCPGCYFFKYPVNFKLFEFSGKKGNSLNCWTKDKQEITLEIFVQVQIDSHKAPEIFDKYMFNYEAVWEQKIKMAMKQTTKNYDTNQFFEERATVKMAIKSMIDTFFQDEGATVQAVHVGHVTIPSRFEEAITTKVVTQQNAATVLMQRNVTLIEGRTNIITKTADSDAEIIVGNARAEASIITERAAATGVKVIRQAEAEGLQAIADDLGLDVDQILEFKYNREIKKLGVMDEIVVGWDDEFLSVKERS